MKIGISLPIGNIYKYGYYHDFKPVLENLTNFADEVVIISNSRDIEKKIYIRLFKPRIYFK